jgi:hypothetical protein
MALRATAKTAAPYAGRYAKVIYFLRGYYENLF